MRKHTVQFYSPGTFVSEQSEREIENWDPAVAVRMATTITERHGAKPYGFRFATHVATEPVPDGEGGFLEVCPRKIAESGVYYLNGTLRTLDEVRRDARPDERVLLSNMECNGMWIIVETRNSYRSTQEFREDDFVVNHAGEIIQRGDDPIYLQYRAEKQRERDAEWAWRWEEAVR